MKLSIVIVNYNVKHFLEQCLNSVQRATIHLDSEVIVVDNNSVDGSVQMVRSKFPDVKLIANKENTGFSKANNQAIRDSFGEYVLLLNPDTVVEEDTLEKVVQFMDDHPDAGGLGVKMFDGKGKFLPESKRGLPTPHVAFHKIFGISALLPKSKRFGKYHLSYLDRDKNHEIDILSGAFMLMRKSVLNQVGLLDESFFMYGEDIDLSYRIQKAGYKNYYFAGTQIIHYKGESTKKGSVNYVFIFYNAMLIFAKKHFSAKNARTFGFLIKLAIYIRAGAAIFNRAIKTFLVPISDLTLTILLLFVLRHYYQEASHINLDPNLVQTALPLYAITWLIVNYLIGVYDKPFKVLELAKGTLCGLLATLTIYSILPDTFRFSRAIVLLGPAFSFISVLCVRVICQTIGISTFAIVQQKNKKFAIVGGIKEAKRVENILRQINHAIDEVCFIAPDEKAEPNFHSASFSQLSEFIRIRKVDEVVFCARDKSARDIISFMSQNDYPQVDYKIAQPESAHLIGSKSIEGTNDLYVQDINSVSKPKNKRNKRLLDIFSSLVMISVSPIIIWLIPKKWNFFQNLIKVLAGQKTWVGYSIKNNQLPRLKPSVISNSTGLTNKASSSLINKLDLLYARNYSISQDLRVLFNNVKSLGNTNT